MRSREGKGDAGGGDDGERRRRRGQERRNEKRPKKRKTLALNHVIVERFNWSKARSAPRWREDEDNTRGGGWERVEGDNPT